MKCSVQARRLPLVWLLCPEHCQPAINKGDLARATPPFPQLDLAEVYSGVRRGMRHYVLSSMFCCSGTQYSALVRTTDLGAWLLVDSTCATRVGAWQDVLRHCEASRMQPSVLFYEAV